MKIPFTPKDFLLPLGCFVIAYRGLRFFFGRGLERGVIKEPFLFLMRRGQLPVIFHQYNALRSFNSSSVILGSIKNPSYSFAYLGGPEKLCAPLDYSDFKKISQIKKT
ncbi:MAG: hypothetical protein NT145_05940 [Elusimicrobia bacterium]|nr:hypothetical protein [Elusimicrobiota bacterium]